MNKTKKYNQLWQNMKFCTTTYSKKKVAFKYKKAKYKKIQNFDLKTVYILIFSECLHLDLLHSHAKL